MIDNRTKSIPTSSSEVGIYYVYISQGNKDNGVYIVSDFVLPITVTKIAELYIGDNTKENVIDIGTTNQYFRGDKTWQTLNKIVVGLPNVDNTADANKNVLSATKLTIPRTINNVTFDGSENIVIHAVDSTPRIPISYMGIANGVATLDNNGIIPITQLPSYVDDVIEVANYASLPLIGASGKIYVTTNNNKTYRWSGSVYVYITSGAVDSVNGYTGVVVLTKSDFILGNVDNTSDANKPISIATQGALDLKQNLLTLGNFTSTTPGITISNGNGAVIGSGITFNITTAGTTTGGLITSGHWNTFNNKWDSNNHPITTLGYGLPDYPTTLPASDVYAWAKAATKPTYTYSEVGAEPSFSKNTAFNKNFGTTTGTVLEGRTFGTAANSAVGDFYAVGATVSNSTNFGSLSIDKFVHGTNSIATNASSGIDINTIVPSAAFYTGYNNTNTPNSNTTDYGYLNIPLWSGLSGSDKSSIQIGGTYGYGTAKIRVVGASGAGTWRDIYHSGNLTSSLTTNYIPKWNGSSMVNSGIYDSGYWGLVNTVGTGSTFDWGLLHKDTSPIISVRKDSRDVLISSTTPSTSPTTGSLVVGGGVGVGGDIHATNYVGKSNGFYTVQITQAAYTALGTKDASTIYMIVG